MKKANILLKGLIITGLLSASLLAKNSKDIEQIKQDISSKMTHGMVLAKDIHIVATKQEGALTTVIAGVKNDGRPLLFAYNKTLLFSGNIINRKNGKSIYENLIKDNNKVIKQYFQQQQSKMNLEKEVKNKKLIKLIESKYKDIAITIQGQNKDGDTIYIISDANCPFCKQEYKAGKLTIMEKKAKKIVFLPVFLKIPGHETSLKKAVWLLSNWNAKNKKVLLDKFFNKDDRSFEEVSASEVKSKGAKIEQLMKTNLIEGTPTVFNSKGKNLR